MMKKREQSENVDSVKSALVRGRRSIQEELSFESGDAPKPDDGYESDCLSIDEYIENDDFFKTSIFPRKRVISVMPPMASHHHNRRGTFHDASSSKDVKREVFQFSDLALEELARKKKYFEEVIDRHVLIIERY